MDIVKKNDVFMSFIVRLIFRVIALIVSFMHCTHHF